MKVWAIIGALLAIIAAVFIWRSDEPIVESTDEPQAAAVDERADVRQQFLPPAFDDAPVGLGRLIEEGVPALEEGELGARDPASESLDHARLGLTVVAPAAHEHR